MFCHTFVLPKKQADIMNLTQLETTYYILVIATYGGAVIVLATRLATHLLRILHRRQARKQDLKQRLDFIESKLQKLENKFTKQIKKTAKN